MAGMGNRSLSQQPEVAGRWIRKLVLGVGHLGIERSLLKGDLEHSGGPGLLWVCVLRSILHPDFQLSAPGVLLFFAPSGLRTAELVHNRCSLSMQATLLR